MLDSEACTTCLIRDLTPLPTTAIGSPLSGASGVGLKERHTKSPSRALVGGERMESWEPKEVEEEEEEGDK